MPKSSSSLFVRRARVLLATISDVQRPQLHRTFLLVAGVTGLGINVVLYAQKPQFGTALGFVLFALVLVAAWGTWKIPALKRRSREVIVAVAYPVVLFDVYGSVQMNDQNVALWVLVTTLVGLFAISVFARRWWEALPLGLLVMLLLLICAVIGMLSLTLATVLMLSIALPTVIVTIGTAARVRTEGRLHRLNADLRSARMQAEESTRAKSQFLATMSHEIRTPLNGVIGMADLLAEADLAPDHADCVRIIRSSADTLLVVVNDVLDFSKIEAGAVEMEHVLFQPERVGRDALRIVETMARDKGLSLSVEKDPGVPDYVLGDATRVRQILLNLLSNAIKFTHKGGVIMRLSYGSGSHHLRFDVTDTGIGIAQDKIHGLFESFTQADASTTRLYGGTGLGLAISRRLAHLMGGDVEVESEVGRGSTFALVIRVERAEGGEEPKRTEAAAALVGNTRILVVEDNAINRKVVVRLLERLDLSADIAEDGLEAVAALHSAANVRAPYDVVLMDVEMPRLNGLDATRRLRAELAPNVQPYVIALTAHSDAGSRAASKDAGCDAHLSKPIRLGALEQALRSAGAVSHVADEA